MQELPLRDEVRKARETAKRAEQAMSLSQQVGIALSAVSVCERQIRGMDVDELELPGDEAVEEAVANWTELAALKDIAPRPDTPLTHQLAQRRMQLRTIDQVIKPFVRQFEEASARVHELQMQQFQVLQRPEYDDLRAELEEKGRVRTRCTIALGRLRGRRQTLLPAIRSVELFLPQTREELANLDTDLNREMARGRLLTLVATIDQSARAVGLEVPIPSTDAIEDPECPDSALVEVADALDRLHDAAEVEAEELDAEIDRLQAELDAATEWMIAHTG